MTMAPTTAPRRRGLTEQAADTAVDRACRMLRLPTIRAKFPELAESAARREFRRIRSGIATAPWSGLVEFRRLRRVIPAMPCSRISLPPGVGRLRCPGV